MSESTAIVSTQPTPPPASPGDELQAELIRRYSIICELQVACDAEKRRLHQAQTDLEVFVRRLAALEDEREALRVQVEELRQPWHRKLTRRSDKRPLAGSSSPLVPGAHFTYYLYTSPYRLFRDPTFTLRGWAFPADGRAVTALRARVDENEFFGTYGIPEPEVLAQHGPQPNNPNPGFKIVIETPPGRHRLSLEARVENGEWASFLTAPLFASAQP